MAKNSFLNAGTLQGRFTDVNNLPSVPMSPYDEEYVIQQTQMNVQTYLHISYMVVLTFGGCSH